MNDLLPEVRRLMSENKGDRVIAETLDITRHKARNLMREIELADAKQGTEMPATAKMPVVLENDADAWALLINGAFRRSYDSTIEAGRLLIAAKEKLAAHGTWLPMLETKLDFSPDTAQRLMAIARDERLTNTAHVRFLPRSYSTLHALTKLSDEEFARGIEQNLIRPDMERKDVEIIRPAPHRERAEHSDGGGESRPAPEGTATASASGQRESRPRDMEAAGSQGEAETGRSPEMARAMEQASDREGQDSDPIDGPTAERGRAGVATGPSETTPMPGGGLAITHNRVEPSDSLDFFPTPPWATRALVEHVLKHLRRDVHCKLQTVWEPACGEGHMAEPLAEYFREVVASDIKDYGYGDQYVVDFLSVEHLNRQYDADWIVTNPPFGENLDKFILKALSLAGTGVAMLVRMQCLESVGRYERIYKDNPPTVIAFFVERVPMHKGRWEPEGDTMTAYVWLVWIKGAAPKAPFWIPPGCREALTRPDDAERFTQKPVAKREHVWPAEPKSFPQPRS